MTDALRTYRVTVEGGSSLTERGWEVLDQACADSELADVIQIAAQHCIRTTLDGLRATELEDWAVVVKEVEA